jgi:hypothetical protein
MSEQVCAPAKYEVFEVSPNGAVKQLRARLAALDDAIAIAEAHDQSRVVVHMGEIVWPPKS